MSASDDIADPFGVFGLNSSAKDEQRQEELETAMRKLAEIYNHADATKEQREIFKRLLAAFRVLNHPSPRERERYKQYQAFKAVAEAAEKEVGKLKAKAQRVTVLGLALLTALSVVVWICIGVVAGHQASFVGLVLTVTMLALGWCIRCCAVDAIPDWKAYTAARDQRWQLEAQ